MIILCVIGETVAFQLGNDIWYLRMGPGISCLYDHQLRKQIVPNMDTWFQSKTGHRYSYRTVCDMAGAFATGLGCSYRAEDVVRICVKTCQSAVAQIFQSESANEYRRNYWIEMLDPVKLPAQAQTIRDNFDKLLEKLGDDAFYNYLCRLWKVCYYQNQNEAAVFERLINRMGRQTSDPGYPNTTELDMELCKRVVGSLLQKDLPQYRNIPDKIMRNINVVQSGRL